MCGCLLLTISNKVFEDFKSQQGREEKQKSIYTTYLYVELNDSWVEILNALENIQL